MNLYINILVACAIQGKECQVIPANTTIASLGYYTFLVANRSFGGWIQFEESTVLKEAGLSDQFPCLEV